MNDKELEAIEILENLSEKNWRLLGELMLVKAERDTLISDMQDHIAVANELALECVELRDAALAQPKREWVGLTDEEIDNFFLLARTWRTIEAKLKERNT